MIQRIFNPADYTFKFTDDGWYEWDRKTAHSQALKHRNTVAKELKAQGYQVFTSSIKDQLITKGGIGSGKPEISMIVNCYTVTAR